MSEHTPGQGTDPAEFWETRYRTNVRSWSGNVNVALEREIAGVAPGSALDLGSGEGGDALWLARQGWTVTAVDISATALAIGAAEQGPTDAITWIAADLAEWRPPHAYDLVTSCFLHSEVDLPREDILRRAATAVAPGGLLLIVGHVGGPHWMSHEVPHLPTPDEVLASLALSDGDWTVVTKALIERPLAAPDGSPGTIADSVLLLRRRGTT